MDWKIHRAILIAAIWIAEVLSAGICGFIAALALIPASYAARGYFAFGGEWLIVLGVITEDSASKLKEAMKKYGVSALEVAGVCERFAKIARATLDELPDENKEEEHDD